MHLSPRLSLPVALLATAALASSASAKEVTYSVEATASGTWELHDVRAEFDWWSAEDYSVKWSYSAEYQDVVFRDGKLVSAGEETTATDTLEVVRAELRG